VSDPNRTYEVIFTRKPKSLFSRLIRWHQKTPYSHVAIKYGSEYYGYDLIFEANWKGVRAINYDLWKKEKNEILKSHSYTVDKGHFRSKLQRSFIHLGAPYSFSTILKLGFGVEFKGDGMSSFICSEIAAIFASEEIPKLDKERDKITPQDLYDAIEDQRSN
jgi:uncharacterized protein YycO